MRKILLGLLAALAVGAQAQQTATLTTETELADPARAAAVDSFWNTEGRDGHFEGRRGVRIAYRSFVQPAGAMPDKAVILVSGRTESMLKYKELIYDLWRAGYSVYTHDHRGQGLSGRESAVAQTPEKGHVEYFDDYVDDLRRFAALVAANGRHRNLYLLAHSMGGAISALFLEQGGREVQALKAAVLSSPMLQIMGPGGKPADLQVCPLAQQAIDAGRATDYMAGGRGYAMPDFKDNPFTHSPVRYARTVQVGDDVPATRVGDPTNGWVARACDGALRARSQADRIRTPVMVLVAGADAIVHPDGARSFCDHRRLLDPATGCGGPDGGPVPIPGASHELLVERDDLRTPALQSALRFFDAHSL